MKVLAGVLVLFLLLVLPLPALAASPEEDIFPAKWMGRHKVVDHFGKLSRMVLIRYVGEGLSEPSEVVEIGDPDNDGAVDAYALLGVRWDYSKYPGGVPYTVNPTVAVRFYGLKESEVVGAIRRAFENWDEAVGLELYNNVVTVSRLASASTKRPDYRNVVTWGRLQRGVVAVTYLWYLTDTGELVDADIVFNSYYRWGIDPDGEGTVYQLSGAFDLQDIATHEVGHFTGLDDLYDEPYWAMTMYGHANFGETCKVSLEPGDIAGAQAIYGS
ncbi:MAG: matrixin family metalloprotease [Candidatus Hadarchaeales archaeon]